MNGFWDRLGISASILCVIHCLLAPVLAISIPLISSIAMPNWFHWVMAVIIFPVALLALWRGYKRHHHNVVLVLGTIGMIFIALGLFEEGHYYEYVFTAVGGGFLVTAHFKNIKACKNCP